GSDLLAVLARDPPLLLTVGREGRLVHDEPGDGQTAGRRMKREDRTGGVAVHRRHTSGFGDQRAYVFDLALYGVGRRVTAVAASPAVVVEHSKVLRQHLGQRTGHRPVGGRPANQDDRRTFAEPLEGDGGAVARSHCVHELSFTVFAPSSNTLILV